jgi:transcriptional regulator
MTEIKDRIISLRNEKNMTQAQLAKELNISPSAIGMYEQGRRKPSYELLEEICDYFNVDMDYLMGRSDIKNRYQVGLSYDWEEEKTSILDDIAITPLSNYELEALNKILTGENSIESAYLSLDKKDSKETLSQILKKLKSLKKEKSEINLSKETHDFYINENLAGDVKYKNKKISIIMGDPKDKSTFKELDLNSDENIKLSTVISLIQLALEKVELSNKGRVGLENLIGEIIKYDFASRENTILKVTPKKYDISQPDISDSINSSGLAAFSGNIKRVKK